MDIDDRLAVESIAGDARRLLGAADLDLNLLSALLLGAPDAILVLDGGDRIMVWNRAAERVFGYSAEQAIGRRVFDLLGEAAEGIGRFTAACAGSETFELAAVRSDGSGIDVELSRSSVAVEDRRYVLGIIRDISERKCLEQEARRSAANFESVVVKNQSGILVVDRDGIIRFANPAAMLLLDRGEASLIGSPFGIPSSVYGLELRVLRPDGSRGTAEMTATETQWEGQDAHLVTLHDVTDFKEAESRAQFLALHDALTGLPNRRLFRDRLEQSISRAMRERTRLALLFLDLDRFKPINDQLGHEVGDRVLQSVGERLMGFLRASDTVARLGGDEFALLLENVRRSDEVAKKVELLGAYLAQPIEVGEQVVSVGGSFGIAFYPEHGLDSETLLRNADTAMYAAKRENSGFCIYSDLFCANTSLGNPSDEPGASRPSEDGVEGAPTLSGLLAGARARGELALHYQPVVRLRDGATIGLEALLRWHSPQLGEVPAGRFIPLLEAGGDIVEVGYWAIERVCRQLFAWRAQGRDPLRVSINLSGGQLADAHLPEQIHESLRCYELSPHLLAVEMSENAVIAAGNAGDATLHNLLSLGLLLCLDDFGSGDSSLGLLKKRPFSWVKIDGALVKRIVEDSADARLVAAIIDLAHCLDCSVAAEGVETGAQLALLEKAQCDFAQGWLFGHPQPAGRIELPAL